MGYWMNYAVPNHERRVYNFGPGTGRYLLVPAFSPILTACAQGRRLTLAEIRRGNREAGEKGWDAWELFEMEPEGAAFPQNWRKNILIGLAKEGEEDQDDVVVEPGQVARVQWLEVEGCAVQGDHILSRIASFENIRRASRNHISTASRVNYPPCTFCASRTPEQRALYFDGQCRSRLKKKKHTRASCTCCQARGSDTCSMKDQPATQLPDPHNEQAALIAPDIFATAQDVHDEVVAHLSNFPEEPYEEDPVAEDVPLEARRAIGRTTMEGRGHGTALRMVALLGLSNRILFLVLHGVNFSVRNQAAWELAGILAIVRQRARRPMEQSVPGLRHEPMDLPENIGQLAGALGLDEANLVLWTDKDAAAVNGVDPGAGENE